MKLSILKKNLYYIYKKSILHKLFLFSLLDTTLTINPHVYRFYASNVLS